MNGITDLTTALGALTGVVGVSIAIWLQLISPKKCPARYVLVFFVFGSVFLLMNAGAIGVPGRPATLLGLIGAIVALVAEVVGAVYVYRRYGIEDTTHEAIEAFLQDRA